MHLIVFVHASAMLGADPAHLPSTARFRSWEHAVHGDLVSWAALGPQVQRFEELHRGYHRAVFWLTLLSAMQSSLGEHAHVYPLLCTSLCVYMPLPCLEQTQ